MRQALLDTDTISFYFRNIESVVQKLDSHLLEFGFIKISVVTYYEILNGLYYKDARKQLEKFERFVELNEIVPLGKGTVKIAAGIFSELRKKGITIGHNDVMIAAVAIEHELTLVTNNNNHVKHINGLDWETWVN